ncbi:MAG: hypothetical protein RIA69_19480, partial [Cyclobacteriaceae bacterium]
MSQNSMMKTIYLSFVLFLSCTAYSQMALDDNASFIQVEARKNAQSEDWATYSARTVDRLPNFNYSKDPKASNYGGWKINKSKATGFFRVEKKDDRWWIIDPDGYPFIHKGVAVFRPGRSENQKKAQAEKYGSDESWLKKETQLLREYGFNGTGAWSSVDLMREGEKPLVYTIIVSPMGSYKHEHIKKFGGEYKVTGWQGYRFDLAMVFDPEFDQHIESAIRPVAKYANDKNLLGYYTDNELPWKNDALDRHLIYLAKDEPGYIAARKWFDERKGKGATLDDITDADRGAFNAFYFETYVKKVAAAVRKYDPNHLYLGCRFNQEKEELQSKEIFEVAGKY